MKFKVGDRVIVWYWYGESADYHGLPFEATITEVDRGVIKYPIEVVKLDSSTVGVDEHELRKYTKLGALLYL